MENVNTIAHAKLEVHALKEEDTRMAMTPTIQIML